MGTPDSALTHSLHRDRDLVPRISIVVPAYNEEEVLHEFYRRSVAVLRSLGNPYEIIFVNDGSRDRTLAVMNELRAIDGRIAIIDLSRNFGKEIALTAGLDHCQGDVIVVIDADLQDPPELIPKLLEVWAQGYDVAYAVRTRREGESWIKKTTASLFYKVIQRVSRVHIPKNTGDYRLMSRRAVKSLGKLREQHRFMKGLFALIGHPSKPVYYEREPRVAGRTKWNYWSLWNLALEGITSFTVVPLKVATYFGFGVAGSSFLFALKVIYKKLVYGDPVTGYPSLMVAILFLGGVQLIFIGVIGEYLGRVFNEVKGRPLYVMNGVLPSNLAAEPYLTATRVDASDVAVDKVA